MKLNTKTALATALLAAFCLLLAAACNGGDEGLSQPEVERIVQEQMAADADQDSDRQTDPHDDGNDQDPAEISADDVAAMVQEALAAQSEGTVTKADVEQAIRTAMAEAPGRTAGRRPRTRSEPRRDGDHAPDRRGRRPTGRGNRDRGGENSPRRHGLHTAQDGPRGVHQVRGPKRRQPVREPRAGAHA